MRKQRIMNIGHGRQISYREAKHSTLCFGQKKNGLFKELGRAGQGAFGLQMNPQLFLIFFKKRPKTNTIVFCILKIFHIKEFRGPSFIKMPQH